MRSIFHRPVEAVNVSTLPIYSASLLLIFHTYTVAYINSSYLETWVGSERVSALYMVAAAGSLVVALGAGRILHAFGNYGTMLLALMVNFVAVMGMALAQTSYLALLFFLLNQIALSVIILNLDVFVEALIGNTERRTGSRRGLLLTLRSTMNVTAPLVAGYILGTTTEFSHVYIVSAFVLIPTFFLIAYYYHGVTERPYVHLRIRSAITTFWSNADFRKVFAANLTLQTFFFFAIVHYPLYMSKELGLSWQTIGLAISLGQLAYVFFEYPIGIVADKLIGEREMMSVGFVLISILLGISSFITTTSVIVWIALMFGIRIGASLAEATIESYFFKHTKSKDAQAIALFRTANPLSLFTGAAVGTSIMLVAPFAYLFVVGALIMLPGALLALSLKDTR